MEQIRQEVKAKIDNFSIRANFKTIGEDPYVWEEFSYPNFTK